MEERQFAYWSFVVLWSSEAEPVPQVRPLPGELPGKNMPKFWLALSLGSILFCEWVSEW